MTVLEKDLEYIAASTAVDYEQFRDKSFLITGVTGLVGSLCAKALRYVSDRFDLHIRVFGIVRDMEKADRMFTEAEKPICIPMDLLKDELPEADMKIDYIIHAAAITNSKMMVSYPVDTILTAVNGTEKLLRFAVENKVKAFVYVSSMEVYGSVGGMASEDSLGYIPLNAVRSCYPESKRLCEILCLSYASQYGLPVCSARLAQTFGAGILRSENRVFAQFAKSALKGEDIVLHTTGESEGNYVYSADAVLALLFLLQKGEKGETYNVNNEKSHCQIREMAEMVAKELSGKIRVVYDIPADASKYGYAQQVKLHLSSQKINALGWKAGIDLKEAYIRMMQYMRETNDGSFF